MKRSRGLRRLKAPEAGAAPGAKELRLEAGRDVLFQSPHEDIESSLPVGILPARLRRWGRSAIDGEDVEFHIVYMKRVAKTGSAPDFPNFSVAQGHFVFVVINVKQLVVDDKSIGSKYRRVGDTRAVAHSKHPGYIGTGRT